MRAFFLFSGVLTVPGIGFTLLAMKPSQKRCSLPEVAGRYQLALDNGARAAFTRTELLLVFALVATFVALLVVVLPRAKDQMRRAQCQKNLGRIGLAMDRYVQEHEKRYPREWQSNAPGPDITPNEGSPTGAWCNKGFDAALSAIEMANLMVDYKKNGK